MTKSSKTLPFIIALGRNFMSICPSSTTHLDSYLDRNALVKMFLLKTLYIQQWDVLENSV